MTIERLYTSPTKSYLTTRLSLPIIETLISRIGHSLTPMAIGQEGTGTMRIVYKFRNSCAEMLYKNSSTDNFGTFSGKHWRWGSILIKLQNKEL